MLGSNMQRVLLIDDSEFDRRMMTRAMKRVDGTLRFVELDNGRHIVKTLHSVKPDLVLLDIRMPGFGGFDVLDIIKQDDEFKACNVVMISGSRADEDKQAAETKGAAGYYTKPHSQAGYIEIAQEISHKFLDHAA